MCGGKETVLVRFPEIKTARERLKDQQRRKGPGRLKMKSEERPKMLQMKWRMTFFQERVQRRDHGRCALVELLLQRGSALFEMKQRRLGGRQSQRMTHECAGEKGHVGFGPGVVAELPAPAIQ